MENLRVALLTSNNLRHKFLAHQLSKQLNLKLIITEEKSRKITEVSGLQNEQDAELIRRHFTGRDLSEKKYFGELNQFPSAKEKNVDFGEINSEDVLNLLLKENIDYILLFGTSIIKKQILDEFPSRVVNFHLGLSPYYKGSATNFWPVVNKELACIGGTFHLASTEVDAGDILHQFRAEFDVDDSIHDLGNKVIKKGAALYANVVQNFHNGSITAIAQKPSLDSKVYRVKDFRPEALKQANINIENGLIGDYLINKNLLDDQKPIISSF